MADDTTIDIDTLEDVHRLLATTEFASVRDLARRGLSDVDAPAPTSRRASAPAVLAGGDGTPLPRRR